MGYFILRNSSNLENPYKPKGLLQGFSEGRAEGEANFACGKATKSKMRSPVYCERLKTIPVTAENKKACDISQGFFIIGGSVISL